MNKKRSSKKIIWLALSGILFLVLLINLALAWNDSQTVDEGAHISAGYSYVTTGDFRLNPEHPSLFKLLAGAAILPLNTKEAAKLDGWDDADQWSTGRDLLYNSPTSARTILFAARIPSILISLLLVISTFFLARRLFGERIGLLAAGLIGIDPTLNGHGHLVTNDVFIALGAVAFILAALKYWDLPNRKNLLLFSAAILLVPSTKFTGVIFIPIGILILALRLRKQWRRTAKHLAAVLIVLIGGIWLQYGLQISSVNRGISEKYAQDDRLTKEAYSLKDKYSFADSLFSVPLPAYSYLRGLATLAFHNNDGHPAYLYGLQSDKGWVFYFPAALGVKLPLLILTAAAGGLSVTLLKRQRIKKEVKRKILLLSGMTVLFLALGMSSNINIGVRHIFGLWPFVYILAAFYIAKALRTRNWWRFAVAIILACGIVASTYGSMKTALAYQNIIGKAFEAVGNKPVLADSNRDWSQDLYRLDEYLDRYQDSEIGEAIFTSSSLQNVLEGRIFCGLDANEPRCVNGQKPPCILAVSDTARYVETYEKDPYSWLPGPYDLADRVGTSISIYTCHY